MILEKSQRPFNSWWKLRFIISVACSYTLERMTYLPLPKSVTDFDTSCERGICVTNGLAHTFTWWLSASNFLRMVSFRLRCFHLNSSWMGLWKQCNSYGLYLLISKLHFLPIHPTARDFSFQFSRKAFFLSRGPKEIKSRSLEPECLSARQWHIIKT